MDIGFIGTGLMGSPMARVLMKAGHKLTLYNRTEAKAIPLKGANGTIVQSAGAAAIDKPLVITMLSDPSAVREVAESFLHFMQPASIWMNCSTIDPDTAVEMGALCAQANVHYLDAPVMGSIVPAEKGELIFLLGGAEEIIEKVAPVTEACGKKHLHLGKIGQGSAAKLVVNLLLAQQMVIFTESMQLAQALNLPKKTMMDLLIGGPLAAPYLSAKKEKILSDQFDPEFPLKWTLKDVRLAIATAHQQGLRLPAGEAGQQLFEEALSNGWGQQDFTALWGHLMSPRR